MTELTPNDATLLATMIGTIGTMWSIGFVALVFLFDQWKEFLANLYPSAEAPASPRLFSLFLWATLLQFASIVLSLVVFVANAHEWMFLALSGFLFSIAAFLLLTIAVCRMAKREALVQLEREFLFAEGSPRIPILPISIGTLWSRGRVSAWNSGASGSPEAKANR